jgi:hypothetical protein
MRARRREGGRKGGREGKLTVTYFKVDSLYTRDLHVVNLTGNLRVQKRPASFRSVPFYVGGCERRRGSVLRSFLVSFLPRRARILTEMLDADNRTVETGILCSEKVSARNCQCVDSLSVGS